MDVYNVLSYKSIFFLVFKSSYTKLLTLLNGLAQGSALLMFGPKTAIMVSKNHDLEPVINGQNLFDEIMALIIMAVVNVNDAFLWIGSGALNLNECLECHF